MVERTRHQEKIIRNYYQNIDSISLQKLGESVSELYLSEGKKRQTVWKRIRSHLEKLKVPVSRIDHIEGCDNPLLAAKLLEELLAKK